MPPFRFRLQRVLQWQERICRLEEDKLRQFAAELAETEGKLARLAAERVSIEQEFAGQTSLSPRDLQALAQYRRRAAQELLALEQEREARGAALAGQREKVLAERRKVQVIEKLRDRALQEHTRAVDRETETVSHESYLSTWIARQ
jgi:flagellar export protein FliJ